jgi:hypothetical protein
MQSKLFIFLAMLLGMSVHLYAADNYCYQKPEKYATGDILILSLSEDVAKYCDFEKQIISIERRSKSSSFNNEDVVCVKVTTPRVKIK